MSLLPVTEAKRTVLAHDQAIPLFHCSMFERTVVTVVIAIVPLLGVIHQNDTFSIPSHVTLHQSADPLISSKQKTIARELLW